MSITSWLKENRLQMHASERKMKFIGSACNLNNIICEETVGANAKLIFRTST